MYRYNTAIIAAVAAVTWSASPASAQGSHAGHHPAGPPHPTADSAFAGVQHRGAHAMGVDQYTSQHVFDMTKTGGRIGLQRDSAHQKDIAQIRAHLQEAVRMFADGDFRKPAFVHAKAVPGAAVMSAKRAAITYTYRELPRGGEVVIRSNDPVAVKAIHEFLAFQRQDHRAKGAKHPSHAPLN